jgi:signal transduction histidine kinase
VVELRDGFVASMARALEVESTSEATRLLLEGLVAAVGADAGRVLLLDLRTGRFHQRSQVGHHIHQTVPPIPAAGIAGEEGAAVTDVLEIAAKSSRDARWEPDVRSAPSEWHELAARFRLVHPVLRTHTAVGLIDIEGQEPFDIADLADGAALLNEVLIRTYERRFVVRLLHELQRSIELNLTRREFFDALAALIKASTGMEFVAIRQHDDEDDALRCVAAVGLGVESGQLHELDWSSLEAYPSFQRALNGETVAEPTIAAEHLASIRGVPHLKNVRSFVALPIVVGKNVTGVLSVAARCPYEFSRVELRGFETVANAIGVAMANFKNLHTYSEKVWKLADASSGALSDLLAQAARHEAKGKIDNAQKRLYLLSESVAGATDREVVKEITQVSEQLKDTVEVLDKMKTKTNALVRGQSPIRVDVRELVIGATNQVSGELDAEEIDVSRPKQPTYIQVIPEAMTLVFLLLLQNSIHAFRSKKAKKRNRNIEVTVAVRQAGSDTVRITFADNATGIDPKRLTIPPQFSDKPWEEALFEPGVTGSSEGTGWGLHLVRTLVNLASGGAPTNIRLIEHRNRVVFALDLPAAD